MPEQSTVMVDGALRDEQRRIIHDAATGWARSRAVVARIRQEDAAELAAHVAALEAAHGGFTVIAASETLATEVYQRCGARSRALAAILCADDCDIPGDATILIAPLQILIALQDRPDLRRVLAQASLLLIPGEVHSRLPGYDVIAKRCPRARILELQAAQRDEPGR